MKKAFCLIFVSLMAACLLLFTSCVRSATSSESAAPQDQSEIAPAEDISKEIAAEESADEPQSENSISFSVCAYLPVNAMPTDTEAFLTEYRRNLNTLDYLILNTGVYWNESGALEISEDFVRTAKALDGKIDLWCTVNPKGALIRSETAGNTIDTAEERTALAQTLYDFACEYHLSGIDIDWEFPLADEWEDFSAWLTVLQDRFGEEIKLSVALYPQQANLSREAVSALDFVNVMAYDHFDEQGFHSTMQTAQDAVDFFLSMGFQPNQLMLGVPAYGRPFDASAQWLLYRNIDLSAVSPDDPNIFEDFSFNSPSLAAQKSAYAKENHLGGVMLYHLLCDRTDQNSLTLALSQDPS